MAYENIQFTIDSAVARLTLNRPDKLNSFNTAMHAEVRDALLQVTQHQARVLVITGAGRGFCAGQDLADRAVAPGGERVDLGESIERNYKPLILASAQSATARDRGRQWCRGGSRGEHCTGLRSRDRREIRELRAGFFQAGPGSRFRGDMDSCRAWLVRHARWGSPCSGKSFRPSKRPRGD